MPERRFLIALLGCLALMASPALQAKESLVGAWPAAQATPPLKLQDIDGKVWHLAELRGKVVIVNFWATWCESCVEELGFLSELAQAERDRLVILGVNLKESAASIRRFPATNALTYPILLDRDGENFKKWGGSVLPTTVLIDRRGKARWRILGALDASNLAFRQALEQLLKQ